MDVREKYEILTKLLIKRNISVTTMESCTCGQIASLITDTEGASAIMKGAYITYSNEAKVMAGVPSKVIDEFGVYSKETAAAMAKCCKERFGAGIGIGVTGSFGNADPNNADSVPGEVFFSIAADLSSRNIKGDQGKELVITKLITIPHKENRLAYKLFVADHVADELLGLLSA